MRSSPLPKQSSSAKLQELISTEGLNTEAAKRYITSFPLREFASVRNGTELNAVLPKIAH